MEVDLPQAAVLKDAFALMAHSSHSPREVWRRLVSAGMQSARSGQISYICFRRALLSPFYLGLIQYHAELYQGEHEPLVDLETWKTVRRKILGSEERWREDNARRHESRNRFIFHTL